VLLHSQIQIRLELPQMLLVFPTFTERFFHVVHVTLSCLQYDSVLSKDSFFVYFIPSVRESNPRIPKTRQEF
jgi:hypothetical protein